MHVLRHTAAMRLLHAGIDTSVIALWLGHEQIETTQVYLHADLELKERAHSPGQHHTRPLPAARLLRRSDYADPIAAITASATSFQVSARHNPEVGIVGIVPTSA